MTKVIYATAPDTSVAGGATETIGADLDIRCVEEVTIGLKVTYNGSATSGATVKVRPQFSDGTSTLKVTEDWLSFAIPLDTSDPVIWMSPPIDVMSLASIDVDITNEDGSYALTVNGINVSGGL